MCFFPAGAMRSEPYLSNFHKHMLSCSCTEVLKRYVDAMMVRAYTQLLVNFSVFVCLCVSLSRRTVQEWALFLAMGSSNFLFHLHFSLLVPPDLYLIWVLERIDLSVELFVPTLLTAAQLAPKNGAMKGVGFVFHTLKIPHPHVWGSSSQRNQSPFSQHIWWYCSMMSYVHCMYLYVLNCFGKIVWTVPTVWGPFKNPSANGKECTLRRKTPPASGKGSWERSRSSHEWMNPRRKPSKM